MRFGPPGLFLLQGDAEICSLMTLGCRNRFFFFSFFYKRQFPAPSRSAFLFSGQCSFPIGPFPPFFSEKHDSFCGGAYGRFFFFLFFRMTRVPPRPSFSEGAFAFVLWSCAGVPVVFLFKQLVRTRTPDTTSLS